MKIINFLLIWLVWAAPLEIKAQQADSLISTDDVQFSDGAVADSAPSQEVLELTDDLVFTDGADSTVGETAASDESVTEVEAAAG
ncbi:hypothetical protein BC792_13814, partial [Sphingobacterium allocomposti]